MTSPATTTAGVALASQRAAVAALDSLGWSLLAADIDLTTGALRVELRRHDGLTATLDRDSLGRASLTRERHVRYEATVGRRSDRCRVERIRREFIGRDRIHGGPRDALRTLANYVGDNAIAPDRRLGRSAIALLLDPVVIDIAPDDRAGATLPTAIEPVGGDQLVAGGAGQGDQGGEARSHEENIATVESSRTANRCGADSHACAEVQP